MAIIEYGDGIFRDTNVIGENVYLAEPGRGQGCDTIWFQTVAQAREFIKKHGMMDMQQACAINASATIVSIRKNARMLHLITPATDGKRR